MTEEYSKLIQAEEAAAQEAEPSAEELSLSALGGAIGAFGSDSLYHKTLQGTPIHGLIASSTSPQNMQIDAITRAGTITSGGVIITVDEEALLDVSAQTFKVLIMLLTIATEQLPRGNAITAEAIQRGRSVSITLEDYMSACKIKDKKTAREQLNAAIFALYGISLEWDETEWRVPEGKSRKVKQTAHHRMRITDHTITREEGNPVKHGEAEVRLSFDMAEYLSGAFIMPYPSALLSVHTQKNPYSFPIGWKLCTLYNMNYGKPTQNRTTVETLLRAAKGIPRYERIAARGQIFDRIIKPFDRDMRALVSGGVLASYYYFDDNGARVDELASLNYQEFIRLNVHYELSGYPDQTPRIEAKERRIQAAITRRKNAARRKQAEEPAEETGAE